MNANPNVDHLDPANWWPAYDLETDRRAIPVWVVLTCRDLDLYLAGTEPGEFTDILGFGLDNQAQGVITVILDDKRSIRVGPDSPVYLAQKDFEAMLPDLPTRYGWTFDALWAHHQAGFIGRPQFDKRAAALRQARDHLTTVLELRA